MRGTHADLCTPFERGWFKDKKLIKGLWKFNVPMLILFYYLKIQKVLLVSA